MTEKKKEEKKKRMAFLVATTSLPAVYARTTTAGTPHARAKMTDGEGKGIWPKMTDDKDKGGG